MYSSCGYALFATDNPEGEFEFDDGSVDGVHRYRRAGREMAFYVAVGDTLRDLVAKRGRLQGPFRTIPDWAWGPWISRNSYEVQAEAVEAIEGMIRRGWPVAAIVQEAWKGESATGDFNNFARDRWPDLDGYWELCRRHDIKTILWQVPILHPTSPYYEEALRRGFLVMQPNGEASLRSRWMRGYANLDFTNPDAVAFWKDMLRDELAMGVCGYKADDGEDIKPTDVFHDGRCGWQLHNEYSTLYNRALWELLEEENVDGLLWARSGSIGIEAYPALWAGDQHSNWDSLRALVGAGLSASISGAPIWGHDIGGFFGNPSPDLYIRWLQFGALSPMMQYHGKKPREPWHFGREAEAAYDLLVKLRMALKPTLVELGAATAVNGAPIMQPMTYAFPDDPRFVSEDTQYMLGPDLLVAPVLTAGMSGRRVLFPEGTWQHWLHPMVFEGPGAFGVPIGLVDVPLFVRQGAELKLACTSSEAPVEWQPEAPTRTVVFDAERPLVRNLNVPVHANAASRCAEVTFEATPEVARRLHVRCAAPGSTSLELGAELQVSGTACSFMLPAPEGLDLAGVEQKFAIDYETESGTVENLCESAVQWGEPLELRLAQSSHMLEPGRPVVVTAQLENVSFDTLSLTLVAKSESDVAIEQPSRSVMLRPTEIQTLSWQCTFADANSAAAASVQVEVQAYGQTLAREDCLFTPQWKWIFVGPFQSVPRAAHYVPFGPEWESAPEAVFEVDGSRRWWQQVRDGYLTDSAGIDFWKLCGGGRHAAAYAMTRFHSDRAQSAEFHFGCDDTLTVWLNGAQVFSAKRYQQGAPNQEQFITRLREGENTLLVKVAQGEGPWLAYAYLTAPRGELLRGVEQAFDDFHDYAAEREPAHPKRVQIRPPVWQIAGPFEVDSGDDLGLIAGATVGEAWPPTFNGQWISYEADARDCVVDFNRALGYQEHTTAFAAATIHLERETPVILDFGSDDGLTLWLNGEYIVRAIEGRALKYDAHRIRTVLPAGENHVLARVTQGFGDWQLSAIFWDATELPYRLLETAPLRPSNTISEDTTPVGDE